MADSDSDRLYQSIDRALGRVEGKVDLLTDDMKDLRGELKNVESRLAARIPADVDEIMGQVRFVKSVRSSAKWFATGILGSIGTLGLLVYNWVRDHGWRMIQK